METFLSFALPALVVLMIVGVASFFAQAGKKLVEIISGKR